MFSRLDLARTSAEAIPVSRRQLNFIYKFSPLVMCLFLFMATAHLAQAQDATPTPTPTAEELRLQEEKKLLLLKKDIEEAKKAVRDAQPQPKEPPAPTATPLAGDATLSEGVRLETELVSYNSVSRAAVKIANDIRRAIGLKTADTANNHADAPNNSAVTLTNIAIYDAQIVKDWRFYKALFPAFEGQVNELRNKYIELLKLNEKQVTHKEELRDSIPAAAAETAIGTGTNLLKSVIDLTALFRTDTKLEGKQVTVNQNALVAELFRELKKPTAIAQPSLTNHSEVETPVSVLSLYYPAVFPPRRDKCPEPVEGSQGNEVKRGPCTEGSTVLTYIGLLFSYKEQAEEAIKKKQNEEEEFVKQVKPVHEEIGKLSAKLARVIELEATLVHLNEALAVEKDPDVVKRLKLVIARLTAEKSGLGVRQELEAMIKAKKDSITVAEAEISSRDQDIEDLTTLNDRFQKFVDEFVKVDSNGVNALALLVKSEDIDNAMKEQSSYWVEIQSVTAGGNNRTRKNLLRYFSGPRIDHSGGVVVEYALYNKAGQVIYSDKVSCYEGYVEPKKIGGLDLSKGQCLAF